MYNKSMMKKFISICLIAFAASTASANDATRLTVIELFTSQGCSSCPPADALLKTMRDRPGILTLSWAVDYWDRLGWKDTFGDPYNSMRQTAYNKRLGLGGVFTPQVILDGRVSCVGSKSEKVTTSLQKARMIERPTIEPALSKQDDTLSITLPATDLDKTIAVRVVWYLGDAKVEVMNGENNGRTLHYTNVVRSTDIITDWEGAASTLTLDVTAALTAGADHAAILLQEEYGHGPIVGAASIELSANTN